VGRINANGDRDQPLSEPYGGTSDDISFWRPYEEENRKLSAMFLFKKSQECF
jgi:hypothetical protein